LTVNNDTEVTGMEGQDNAQTDIYWFVSIFPPGCQEPDVRYSLVEPEVGEEGDFVSFSDAETGESIACTGGISVMFCQVLPDNPENCIPPEATCHVAVYLPSQAQDKVDFYMKGKPWWQGRNHAICVNVVTGAQIVFVGQFKMICREFSSPAYQAEEALLRQICGDIVIDEDERDELQES
jgi:hypothetical protein